MAEKYVAYGLSTEYGLAFSNKEAFISKEYENKQVFIAVKKLIQQLEEQTRQIIISNKDKIKRLVKELLKYKTLTGTQVYAIFEHQLSLVLYQAVQSIS